MTTLIKSRVVLVVDDDILNLELISDYLDIAGIRSECVNNGTDALERISNMPENYSAVLLDRMMPGLNGMDVLRQIKNMPEINRLPVIMQTAKISKQDMVEGFDAGAHYYLTKPYDQQTLVAIVKTAIHDYQHYIELQQTLYHASHMLEFMHHGVFCFKTLDDGRKLAAMLANACPESEKVVVGLTELMINSVEHGNLGIGYSEKSELNENGNWEQEVLRRLDLPENMGKEVSVKMTRRPDEIELVIRDQGEGFDWPKYMDMSPDRAFDSHGRGIAMAKSISFDSIQYRGKGNEVCVTVHALE